MTDSPSERVERLESEAADRPAVIAEEVVSLADLLAHDDDSIRADAYRALRTAFDPEREDHRAVVRDLLTSDDGYHRLFAARVLDDGDFDRMSYRDDDRPPVGDLAEPLVGLVGDRSPTSPVEEYDSRGEYTPEAFALRVLADLSQNYPDDVAEVVAQVLDRFSEFDEAGRTAVLRATRRLGRERSDALYEHVETFVEQLESESETERQRATETVGRIALSYPGRVEPYIDDLVGLLADDDEFVRQHALDALAAVARSYPEAVEPVVPRLRPFFLADEGFCQQSAADVLAFVHAGSAGSVDVRGMLPDPRELHGDDPERRLRVARAYDAVASAPDLGHGGNVTDTPAAFEQAVVEAAPQLAATFDDEATAVAKRSASALQRVVGDASDAVAEHVDDLVDLLAGPSLVAQQATHLIEALGKADPDALVPVVSELMAYVESDARERRRDDVLTGVTHAVAASPEAAEAVVARAGALLGEENYLGSTAASALAAATQSAPDLGRPVVEAIVERETDHRWSLQAWLERISAVARWTTDPLVPLPADLLRALLDVDLYTQHLARGVVRRVLDAHPEETDRVWDRIGSRVGHDERAAAAISEVMQSADVVRRLVELGAADALASAVRNGGEAAEPAASALGTVARHRPDEVVPLVDVLAEHARDEPESAAFESLAALSASRPSAVASAAPVLVGPLPDRDDRATPAAARALSNVAAVAPDAVPAAVEAALDAALDAEFAQSGFGHVVRAAERETREYAARALGAVWMGDASSGRDPRSIPSVRNELVAALDDAPDPERVAAAESLAGLAAAAPRLVSPVVDDLERAVTARHVGVRGEAARALAYCLADGADVARSATALSEAIGRRLAARNTAVAFRWPAVEAVGVVGEESGAFDGVDLVRSYVDAGGREGVEAIRCVGRLGDERALSALEAAEDGATERVREAVAAARARIEGGDVPDERVPPHSAYVEPSSHGQDGKHGEGAKEERTDASPRRGRSDEKRVAVEATGGGDSSERARVDVAGGAPGGENVRATTSESGPESGSGRTWRVPDETPDAPEIEIAYDDLQEREPVGAGGNADVYRATVQTRRDEVEVAVKEPRINGTITRKTVERMVTEAETWAKLDDHDHVVGVVDHGTEPLPWIAVEYMDGGHLGERRSEFGFEQALWTAVAVTDAMAFAHHRGVAHLDLKPSNVLFRTVEDGWDVPKVADWGLAKFLLNHSEKVDGYSPQYAAPEQFDDAFGATDHRTDVYQLGALCYELFTGRPPFEGQTGRVIASVLHDEPEPPTRVADVPDALDDVLLTALTKEKEGRYESALYFRDALRELRGVA